MSVERVDTIRERHTPEASHTHEGMNSCSSCGQSWPCDTAIALDALGQVEAERDALRDVIVVLIRMAEDSGRRTSLDDALAMFGLSRETLAPPAADSGTPPAKASGSRPDEEGTDNG